MTSCQQHSHLRPDTSRARWRLVMLSLGLALTVAACTKPKPLFSLLSPDATGIGFVNEVHDSDSLTILDYLYFYNGGGVAAGDLDNDGWVDLYFSANQGPNKLYINRGKRGGASLQFEDITAKAGVQGSGNWKTGVTLVDINADGRLDIYLCAVGGYSTLRGRNQLFINNGTGADGQLTFTEKARAYGLAIEGFNTQATFFDYDRDGDLDAFIVNHSVHSNASYGNASKRLLHDSTSGDKLMRNDSTATGRYFTEVTEPAGIYNSLIGYGLNAVAGDLNNDGWDDLYVSNDFHENDYYYLNNGSGSTTNTPGNALPNKAFSEINQRAFGHESRFSMGSDIGDVNNDGWLDIITLDMLPGDEKVLKSSAGEDPLDIYQYKLSFGYHHQYARNCLQLNVGGGQHFSDIALYAGVAATDWSWSPLLADFNNDGINDLFITNGIQRRPNDLDYVKYTADPYVYQALMNKGTLDHTAIAHMPTGEVHHYVFQGTDSLRFIDQSLAWGFDAPTLANGAVYADLDNDGDLDLVTNAMNRPAGVYRNNASEQGHPHFLTVHLQGEGANRFGIGAKVVVKHRADGSAGQSGPNRLQLNYQTTSRGFESGSTVGLHFGLGEATRIDSLEVIWPDGRTQLLTGVPANRQLTLRQRDARPARPVLLPTAPADRGNALFVDATRAVSLPYKHHENNFVDFGQQPLLPHQLSTQGPKLAVADVNGDQLDDVYVGGARGQPGQLFQQVPGNGPARFVATNGPLFAADSVSEEVNALFFDANGDGAPDLYVVCGGNEFEGKFAPLLDRLYLNDGRGHFTKTTEATIARLPALYGNKSVAVAADVDHDGDQDLFVGGRVVADQYGLLPTSYLLLNNGKGQFTVAPDASAPGLKSIGLVTDAVWSDIDHDGWPDLVVVGEWMPVTVFKNRKGRLTNQTADAGLAATSGLWQTVRAVDLDGDGDEDLLGGNWGENTKLSASSAFPLSLYPVDIDENGTLEQLLAVGKGGKYYPFLGKEELEKQMPGLIRRKYVDYKSFALQTVGDVFGKPLEQSPALSASTLASMLFVNDGHGRFAGRNLPPPAQWSPIMAFATGDVNHDGRLDVLTAGNFYGVLPYEGRYDAGYGGVLLGNGQLQFRALTPLQSGWQIDGEGRSIRYIRGGNGRGLYAVARNNAAIQFYTSR